jgi:serine phosphatase RsbU (regulator of sigma subunit)/anti-sigma regulatory factor (Ser/Thr protein kinase)
VTSSPSRASARVSASFPPAEASVSAARRLVTSTLAQWGAEDLVDDATLLVSELVTNAVVHAGTEVDVTLTLLADAVEVAVTDRHPTRPVPPPPADVDGAREDGRGLLLTSALSASWGVDYTERTKRVWFRLPLRTGPVPAPRAADDDALDGDSDRPVPGVGTVRLDPDGDVVEVDATAAVLLGRDAAELRGRRWLSLCAPEDAAAVLRAAAFDRWQGSYLLRRGDGGSLRVQARHVRMPGTSGRADTLCVLVDHRLRVLLADSPALTVAAGAVEGPFTGTAQTLVRLQLDEILGRTVAWARDALGGDGAYALLVTDDDGELELRSVSGLQVPAERVPRHPGEGVAGRLARDLMPVVHDELAEGGTSYEEWLRGAGARSVVAAPILAEGRLIGLVGVTSAAPGAFTTESGARLQRAVDSVALAVQSARVAEIERRRHGWLGYLAEASELLAGTLEIDMALALVTQLVVPRLGPWSAVHLLDESGQTERTTAWHADEDRLEDLQALLRASPPPRPSAAVGAVRWLPSGGLPDSARDLAEAGGHTVALVARGRALGFLTVGHLDSNGGPRQRLHLLADLAPRAALAVDNARLYADRSASSEALQRSLLPPDLPQIGGVDVGVVYEATGVGNEVGGDFYDFFRTAGPGGDGHERFAFAVGDVCGKGPEAAAVTGLARHALRLLSRRGDDIPSVLRHLNSAILAEGSRARFVTVVYGEGERTADGSLLVRFSSAGHPAPVLLREDGSAAPVGAAGDLLGIFEEAQTPVETLRIAPGESLVCFTDGVTERRSGTRMLGEEGVLETLAGGTGLSATALARRLGAAVSEFAVEAARDDVAILVLRAMPTNGEVRPPARAG